MGDLVAVGRWAAVGLRMLSPLCYFLVGDMNRVATLSYCYCRFFPTDESHMRNWLLDFVDHRRFFPAADYPCRLLFPLLAALSDGRWLLQLFIDRRLSTGAGASRLLSLLYDGAATASCLLNCCNGYLTNLFNWISYFSIHLFQLILLRCLSCSSFDTGSTSMAAVEQAWLQ